MKCAECFTLVGAAMLGISCVHVSSDTIEVKPIHIVADINLRVDRELDQFFAFQDKYHAPTTGPSTHPATLPVSTLDPD